MSDPMDDRVAVTIIHGDVESEAEAKGLEAVRHSIEKYWIATQGTNDTTTFHLRRAGVETLMRSIQVHKRTWWRVTMLGQVDQLR